MGSTLSENKDSLSKHSLATEWLLVEEFGWSSSQEVVVNQIIQVEFDFYGVGTIELDAILDTGSQVSF